MEELWRAGKLWTKGGAGRQGRQKLGKSCACVWRELCRVGGSDERH